jgi:hypothetical protein
VLILLLGQCSVRYCQVNAYELKDRLICFYNNGAGERGNQIATYDYADWAEKLFGIRTIFIFPKFITTANPASHNRRKALPKFQSRFGNVSFCGEDYTTDLPAKMATAEYSICSDLTEMAKRLGCEFLYILKAGQKSSDPKYPQAFTTEIPTGVHAVFLFEPHGTTYAAISPMVVGNVQNKAKYVVPFMVVPPDRMLVANATSMRSDLNIPESALVICRHGGATTFDIPYVQHAVIDAVQRHNASQLHFVFLSTNPFCRDASTHGDAKGAGGHPLPACPPNFKQQAHFLPIVVDLAGKERYFKTCDVMLHGRMEGETFGLAVAEFSVRNKLVVTQANGVSANYGDAHLEILKDKALYYKGKDSLMEVIDSLVKNGVPANKDFNAYKDYEPDKIMLKFKEVFLDPVFNKQ